jgi:hypothetical protein
MDIFQLVCSSYSQQMGDYSSTYLSILFPHSNLGANSMILFPVSIFPPPSPSPHSRLKLHLHLLLQQLEFINSSTHSCNAYYHRKAESKHQLTCKRHTLYSNTTKEFQKASKWTLKRGLELVQITVAGRSEGFGVFETLSDVVDVSLVLQDPPEVVAVRDQPLHVDGFREIAHFLGLLRTGSVSLLV